ncbi:uncharacterized protein FOMMEDRAFT_137589 [Fomitiporia mediterranea MF3/22]|uniref:F-box domain-containing protein n=1 Tax=Fomitiporia mediterranea (strain MF3/22) TaxID=694068 RepID=R7SGL9_FOMME|nr:uncharacterized protein FOMMEDRAFT_137589 [Fomitiporia mediterranea MF3/22]EJC97570.1 hypothetical protein FOMMEDRAFT_137589 [Fomitiporia mediterranea MF3/22]
MQNILTLPQDILSLIWSELSLADILRVSQTCCTLSSAILNDKQLWICMYEQIVVANDLCIPNYLGNLEHVHVRDIQSWVKHAVLLDRNYRTPYKKLHARRIANREKLGITWLRLVHGRWALVASADVHTCEFSVWEIPPEGEIRQVARVFLDAPVMDGMVDESCEQIRCAITIGASRS